MDAKVYAAVSARENGRCACGCGQRISPGHADHFFGRAKAEETEFNVWLLHPLCDLRKTQNKPTAGYWLRLCSEHGGRHVGDGHGEAALEAQKKLDWMLAKGTTT